MYLKPSISCIRGNESKIWYCQQYNGINTSLRIISKFPMVFETTNDDASKNIILMLKIKYCTNINIFQRPTSDHDWFLFKSILHVYQ